MENLKINTRHYIQFSTIRGTIEVIILQKHEFKKLINEQQKSITIFEFKG